MENYQTIFVIVACHINADQINAMSLGTAYRRMACHICTNINLVMLHYKFQCIELSNTWPIALIRLLEYISVVIAIHICNIWTSDYYVSCDCLPEDWGTFSPNHVEIQLIIRFVNRH